VKSGCVSRELRTPTPQKNRIFKNSPLQKSGIRKSKTGRWRAAALILLNLFMIAHIIQWRVMGKTVSPIEPSETMYTLQKGFINAGFIFFSLAILATLIFGRYVCGWAVTSSRSRISVDGC
jgi:polyferredoxin